MKGPIIGVPITSVGNNATVLIIVLLLVTACPSFLHHCQAREEPFHRTLTAGPRPWQAAQSFNVLQYGAMGHGTTDDTKAFMAAWSAACAVVGASTTVLVPAGHVFLVGPVAFSGDSCHSNMIFQVDGTILAHIGSPAWGYDGRRVDQWLGFVNVTGLRIQGSGTMDGQGSHWWGSRSSNDDDDDGSNEMDDATGHRPAALRVFLGDHVAVTGITIKNSPKFHITLDSCSDTEVHGVTVSSPGNSPNTDGIHLTGSAGVSISNATVACGDDCVSIQRGCSNVSVSDMHCGPGHGISIGGLGKGGSTAVVSNVTVEDVTLNGTTNGLRIKTWQGGSGAVSNVRFSGVQVAAVRRPIVINQYYCDEAAPCGNRTSAVAVSGVTFSGVTGTYTEQPLYLACSDATPCSGIHLADVRLTPGKDVGGAGHHLRGPFCWKAHGDVVQPVEPPVDCLI